MLRAAVIPKRDRVSPPAESKRPLRLQDMVEWKSQDGSALLRGKPIDLGRERGVHVDQFLFAFGMPNDYGMDSDRGSDPKDLDPVVRRGHPLEERLHAIRQGIISAVHARKHCVAATVGRDN